MMQNSKTKVSEELIGIDRALNRAAINAKIQAERLGTPYVVRPLQETQQKTDHAKTK